MESVTITAKLECLILAFAEIYPIQPYVTNFVSGFICLFHLPLFNKTDSHNTTEILLNGGLV
jgi:hypothetical protein